MSEEPAREERCALAVVARFRTEPPPGRCNLSCDSPLSCHKGVPRMKPIVAVIAIAGLVGACTYRHETVERPAAPAATVVATPVPASNTVVYTEPAPATATTTVYTR